MKPSKAIKDYILSNIADPWVGTDWEGYRGLDPKQKGQVGEMYVEEMMTNRGYKVKPAATSTAGHDRVIGRTLVEIKFSVAQSTPDKKGIKDNVFIINHVGEQKDWTRLIFVGINSSTDDVIKFMTKSDFKKCRDIYFNPQQGGKKSANDDWICCGKKLQELLKSKYMRDISKW